MFVSVIVPVFNGRQVLERSLGAIRRSDYPHFELIVADDGSTDGSAEVSRKFADSVLESQERHAPGFTRNRAARNSRGDVLFFVDADVEIRPGAISRIVEELSRDPGIAAVFGSYDETPLCGGFFSQYKNLFHHYVHQKASPEAKTFWAGCGAVRREAFLKAGGFAENFSTPAIEDVVLGYRMTELGLKIRLLKDLQAKHLKRWTLGTLLKTDIFHRAIPWSRLASRKGLPRDLNFRLSDRLSAMAAWGFLASLCLCFFSPVSGIASFFFAALLLGLNRDLYVFFLRKKGLLFTAGAVLFHWFYLFYSSFIFALFFLLPQPTTGAGAVYWNRAISVGGKKPGQDLWRAGMKAVYLDLFDRWMSFDKKMLALKTDLYDEAVSEHSVMPLLMQRCRSVLGIDISCEVVQAASGRLSLQKGSGSLKVLVSDTRALGLGTDSFDLIFSNSTLDHFKRKKDIRTALRELARVLRPGGALLVTLDNPLNPVIALRNLMPYSLLKRLGLIPYFMGRTMTRRELIAALSSCGLEVLESAYVGHAPRLLVVWLGRFLPGLERAIGKFERLEKWPSAALTGYFVAVKAVKK